MIKIDKNSGRVSSHGTRKNSGKTGGAKQAYPAGGQGASVDSFARLVMGHKEGIQSDQGNDVHGIEQSEASQGAGALRASAPITSLDAIKGEVPSQNELDYKAKNDDKAYEAGHKMILDMKQLQLEMLGDGITQETLKAMQDHMDYEGDQIGNDDLKQTLKAIELRTKVELAKIKRSKN